MVPTPLRLSALLLLASLAGCAGGDGGDGSASVYVKDAVTDEFTEVHVVFTDVSVHRSGGGGDEGTPTGSDNGTGNGTGGNSTLTGTNTTEDGGSQAGWMSVFHDDAGVHVDLMDASGARAAFLGEADLEAGDYQQIRITVKEAFGVNASGAQVPITVPSKTLKFVRSFEVEGGMETRIVLDFDLERSLKQSGNGQWRLTPVIGKTFVEVLEDGESGEETSEEGEVTEIEGVE
jgi:hypothetical protein